LTPTSLFLVRSPLQLFNCVEAALRYPDCGRKVLVLLHRKGFDRDLMAKILEDGDVAWDDVTWGDIRSNGTHLRLVGDLLRRLPPLETCFLGDSTHLTNLVVNRRSPRKVVLVDDGTHTYIRARMAAARAFGRENSHQEPIGLFRRLLDRAVGFDESFLNDAAFFTIYDDVAAYSPALEVVRNDYRRFRETVAGLPVRDEALFIGSDLIGDILVDPGRYEAYLARVVERFGGRKWTYVMHRKENEVRREYLEGMSRKYGFTLAVYDRILEQHFRARGWRPALAGTIFSTALDTLQAIYGMETVAFVPDLSDIREKYRFVFGEMHARYRSRGVTISPLSGDSTPPGGPTP
jgi:hypothetical protein